MATLKKLDQMYLTAFNKNWGWFLVWGIAIFALGIVAIGATTFTTLFSVIFLGSLLLLGGIVIIIDTFSFWRHKWSGFFLHLIIGIFYCAIGIMLIQSPAIASISITLLLGIFYLAVGIFRIVNSLSLRTPKWGWIFFNGLVSVLLGILILTSWPASGLFIIGLFIGIDLLFSGMSYIMMALTARSLTKI
jgi:uncharacterized membrane protein HdeD (DUF308 family)